MCEDAAKLEKKEGGLWQPEGGLVEDLTGDVVLPKKLATAPAPSSYHETLPFETFALSDEGTTVKLYFGLKGAKEILPPESVTAYFRVQALELVAKVTPQKSYRFHESILFEHIVPDKCKLKIKTDHILVSMPKVYQNAHWDRIDVNRKAIGPVRKSPPDFGKPIILIAGGNAARFDSP
mmetsp:Transcript_20267/g.26237  ORF Transcript_20267/g.26237 Transcript_20267/m.26237 type:complete len:179 (+) Transcript_20267:215-751(+)